MNLKKNGLPIKNSILSQTFANITINNIADFDFKPDLNRKARILVHGLGKRKFELHEHVDQNLRM